MADIVLSDFPDLSPPPCRSWTLASPGCCAIAYYSFSPAFASSSTRCTKTRPRTPAAAALSRTPAPPAAGTTVGTSTPAPPTTVTTTGTSAPEPSSAVATTRTWTGGTADADADAGGADMHAEQHLDDTLASLMAEIDSEDGTAAEAAPELSDADSFGNEAGGASMAGDIGSDSDDSATRAPAVGPTAWGRSNEAKGKTKMQLTVEKAAYEAAFGETPYHVEETTLLVKYEQLLERLTRHRHCRVPMTVSGAENVCALAKEFVLGFMVPILGECFSTKVHKLLVHVISAIQAQGAVTNGDESSKETLHA